MFRENHNVDDISKEPLSVHFSTVMAFGTSKNPDKTKLMMNYQPQSVQSQSNIISSLSLYKYQMAQNSLKKDEQVKPEDVPRLSDISQEVKQGYISEIQQALKKNEIDE